MEQNPQRTDEIEIDLREVFGVLWSKALTILLAGLLLGLAALVGTKLLITPQYESTTKMYVLTRQSNDTLTSSDMQTSTYLTKDYAELIMSRTVIESVIADLGLDIEYDKMLKKITVDSPTDTRIVSISVKDEDPYQAREIANAIRDAAGKHIQNVMDTEAVNVVEEANIPDKKASPSLLLNTCIGVALGIFLAVAVILIIHVTNDTIRTQEDVERYLGVGTLGAIPLATDEKKSKKSDNKKNKKH